MLLASCEHRDGLEVTQTGPVCMLSSSSGATGTACVYLLRWHRFYLLFSTLVCISGVTDVALQTSPVCGVYRYSLQVLQVLPAWLVSAVKHFVSMQKFNPEWRFSRPGLCDGNYFLKCRFRCLFSMTLPYRIDCTWRSLFLTPVGAGRSYCHRYSRQVLQPCMACLHCQWQCF